MKRQSSELFCSGDREIGSSKVSAFTIVELLVVIVVIGILAAVTIVSYSGISNQAIAAMLKSDLDNNSKLLKMYNVEYGYYPDSLGTDNCPNAPTISTAYCLKASKGATISYSGGGQEFTLTSTHDSSGRSFQITETGVSYAVTGAGNTSTFVRYWDGTTNADDEGYSVIKTSDGGFVVAGQTSSYGAGGADAFVSKYNSNGILAWSRVIGESGYDGAESIIQTTDGGYAICGFIDTDGDEDAAAFVSKLSSNGTVSWSRSWDRNGNSIAHSVVQLSDGGLAVVGFSSDLNTENQDAFVAKYNISDGSMDWNRVWTTGDAAHDEFTSAVATDEGGLIASGSTESFGTNTDILIAKLTSSGTLSWSKTWGSEYSDGSNSIARTSDGGYILAGYSSNDSVVIKLSSNGDFVWDKLISVYYQTEGVQIVQKFDGKFALTSSRPLIAGMSSNGEVSWLKKWFLSEADLHINSITQLSDGGLVSTGYFYDGYSPNVMIYKTRADGSMRTCVPGECGSELSEDYSVSSPSMPLVSQSVTLRNPTVVNETVIFAEASMNPTETTIVSP